MTPGARAAAAIEILDRVNAGCAAERALTTWARASRFAGSGDRAAVRDLVFDALRRRRSAAALGGGGSGRALILGLIRLAHRDPSETFTGEGHAPPPLTAAEQAISAEFGTLPEGCRHDLPDWLLPELRRSLGSDLAAVAARLRTRAPVGLRVNIERTDQGAAEAALAEDGIDSAPHPLAKTARVVTRNARRLRTSRAYREGLVELQDPASQAVVETLLPVARGARVLDYCAGGGGKALALAAATGGPVAAFDADPGRMRDIPVRAARAGADIRLLTDAEVRAEAPWDLVLADAPCSGSGAWRRHPEGKWTLSELRLRALLTVQSEILAASARLVRPGGRLAYATCSLLDSENRDQVDRFLASSGDGWRLLSDRRMSPLDGGDGFYVAQLKRE